ncbi:hypothetical protein RUM43_007236 [Polyplax serrata]|uniref:Uncharacterized protein n=1 Tax=Polyplax serrata TaxID=468196 RepID=A0AAN8PCC0_POLSC
MITKREDHPPQKDVDLIEVLWKQDVDLGFSLNTFTIPKEEIQKKVFDEEDIEKLKALEALKKDKSEEEQEEIGKDENDGTDGLDPWSGLSYRVDLETGAFSTKVYHGYIFILDSSKANP